jgi:hypothetical protein
MRNIRNGPNLSSPSGNDWIRRNLAHGKRRWVSAADSAAAAKRTALVPEQTISGSRICASLL